jgi:hypothetical protein
MRPERIAGLLALATAIFGGLLLIGAGMTPRVHPDADAYWLAAQRLRDGLPLYGGSRVDETEIYRYAPWFAYAWLPLTYLPHAAALAVWRGILLLAAAIAVGPLIRRPSPASLTLATLMFALLVSNLQAANVTALIVGALVVGLRTRAGPVILGLAASLKLFPILFVAGYVAERRWRDAGIALGVTALLWIHVLAFGLSTFPTGVSLGSFYVGGISLFGVSPVIWAGALAILGIAIIGLVLRRSSWTWLAVGAAIPLIVPRVWIADAAYVLVGAVMFLQTWPRKRPGA